MEKKTQLVDQLSFLTEGEALSLGEDTFLCGELDGSDKIYGFFREDGEIMVKTRQGSYPVMDMENAEINYIFNDSPFREKTIFSKIENNDYQITDAESL
jgi:hypothetical protein